MGGLFTLLRDRVDRNARRAVEVYTTELPDYRTAAAGAPARSAMLDFAVLLRRREAELAADGAPFAPEDLAVLHAFGAERGRQGVSLAAQRHVMALHTTLTLREVQEAAGARDIDHLMHMLTWLSTNGLTAQRAYTNGFLEGQRSFLPLVSRIRQVATALLDDDVSATEAAEALGLRLSGELLVLSVRVPGAPESRSVRDQILDALLRHTRVPMVWDEPDELLVILPGGQDAEQRALAVARQAADLVERPCAVGAATAKAGALAEAAALATRVSRTSPLQARPTHLPTVREMFIELGVAELPEIGEWLTELERRLSAGPDLLTTLDTYYRHDMNRINTAGELRIHPRTLDYRLHRVRDLVGIEPGSTRGVRTLTAVVARLRAG